MALLPYARYYPPKIPAKTEVKTQSAVSVPKKATASAERVDGSEPRSTPKQSKKRKRGERDSGNGSGQFISKRAGTDPEAISDVNEDDTKNGEENQRTTHTNGNGIGPGTVNGNEEQREKKGKKKSKQKRNDVAAVNSNGAFDLKQREKYASIFAKYEKSGQTTVPADLDQEFRQSTEQAPSLPKHGLEPIPQPEREPPVKFNATYSILPSWLAEPIIVPSSMSLPFSDMRISPTVLGNIEKQGYKESLAIQTAVLPLLLPGTTRYDGDLCISAATGSGKTLAYAIPMIDDLSKKSARDLRGLIVVPTRELVYQVRDVVKACAVGTGLRVGTAVGSKTKAEEEETLVHTDQVWNPEKAEILRAQVKDALHYDFDKHNPILHQSYLLPDHIPEYRFMVDILVSTPGRLVDHIRGTKGFSLRNLSWLVIDEADRLLDQSFQEWVDILVQSTENTVHLASRAKIVERMWNGEEAHQLRKVILSATMTRDLSKLASLRLRNPTLVAVSDEAGNIHDGLREPNDAPGQESIFELPPGVTEWAVPAADGSEKPLMLSQLLRSHLLTSEDSKKDGIVDERTDHSDTCSDLDSQYADNTLRLAAASAKVLIFTRSDEDATRLSYILHKLQPSSASIFGTLTKSASIRVQRKHLNAFRRGETAVLIASDRVSRGIDVKGISHVVNYDIPTSVTSYVHRAGRTARAGANGEVWTFIMDHEARWFWNEIARNPNLRRQGRKVERFKVDVETDQAVKEGYEMALKELKSAVLNETSQGQRGGDA